MKILVLNSGSSSVKLQLFDMPEGSVLAAGKVERIGEPSGHIEQTTAAGTRTLDVPIPDHNAGLRSVIELLTGDGAPLSDIREIGAVGHRVVHGGERFTETALLDDYVVAAIEEHSVLAPLHNPPNLLGIEVARRLLPDVPQVAVFDTAFHQSMPEHAYLYALPSSLYLDGGIRRYGFHGTSHRYVAARAAEFLGKAASDVNLVTCHLGNGSSIAAVAGGRSVDTSMGLTPLEGLVMGTRSGDIDPAIIFHLNRAHGMQLAEIDTLLNKKSGLLGLSGKSNDVRKLEELAAGGDADARRALAVFTYRIRKYIGAYMAALGRVDAVVFTAGIGENSASVRSQVCEGLEPLGISVDPSANEQQNGQERDVSRADSAIRILVIPTNEEKLIASDTYRLATARQE